MVGCSVFGCQSNSERKKADVTFHAFPTDDETRKKWTAATGKKNWVPHKYSRICSEHFERHCFRKTQKLTFIEKLSIPTLFIHNDPVPEVDPKDGASTAVDSSQAQLHVSLEKYPKFSISHEVPVELLPTESMDCQSRRTHAKQHSVTVKSIECAKSSKKSVPCTEDPIMSPSKFKLMSQLNRQTLLAESRRKTIEALRSKNRRLKKCQAKKQDPVLSQSSRTPQKPQLQKPHSQRISDPNSIARPKGRPLLEVTCRSRPTGPRNDYEVVSPPCEGPSDATSSDTRTHTNTNKQDPLIKITEQCRFCGEHSTEWIDMCYIPFLNDTEFSIVFNDISIRLDLTDDSLPKTVCINCSDKLQTVRDFVTLVKEAQDSLKIISKGSKKSDPLTNKSNRSSDHDEGIRDTFEDKTVRRIDDDDEETRDAFEDEDLIKVECQSPTDEINADIGDIEYEIKTEYESDDNKESTDPLAIAESVILENKRICEDTIVNEFKIDIEVNEEAVEMDYTNEDSLKVSEPISDYIAFNGTTISLIQVNKRKKETENRQLNEKHSDIQLRDTSDS